MTWDNFVVALDARTGQQVRQTNRGGNLYATNTSGPIVVDGVVIAGSNCQVAAFGCFVTGHDARTAFEPTKMRGDLEMVEKLKETEVPAGVPMARWALAWCLKNPIVTAVIPGCKNPEQVEENAKAAALIRSPEARKLPI